MSLMGGLRTLQLHSHWMVRIAPDELVHLAKISRQRFCIGVAAIAPKPKPYAPQPVDLLPLTSVIIGGGFERAAHHGQFTPALGAFVLDVTTTLPRLSATKACVGDEIGGSSMGRRNLWRRHFTIADCPTQFHAFMLIQRLAHLVTLD